MDAILVKVFATALALSQVIAKPDAVKTEFDPTQDQAQVMQILSDGCAQIRKSFDIENINLDDLIDTVMIDTRSSGSGEVQGFKGIKFADLHLAYRQICKRETLPNPVVDTGQLIEFYNQTLAGLPDHNKLKNTRLPSLSTVFDAKGKSYAELFEAENRRIPVRLSEIPKHVRDAFVAAEDKRFFEHKGVDERSVIRAFLVTLTEPGRRQGGSTITQQVAKNLLVGDDISYERKIREIVAASRVEQALTKDEILELYLNAIFLGRGAWGIEMAARSYFNKSAKDLTILEGAFLAGLTKGPNFYNPDRHPTRAHERLAYVLDRMKEDGAITEAQARDAAAGRLQLAAYDRPRRTSGFYFVDYLNREAKSAAKIDSLTARPYVVRSTVIPDLQRAAEAAMQDGLARYEQSMGRVNFQGGEASLTDAIRRINANPNARSDQPAWQQALIAARTPLYDVQWQPAVVVERARIKGGHETIRVGLRDGRVLPLSTWGNRTRQLLNPDDLVYVSVIEPRNKQQGVRVELRSRPQVQGAAVVLENATGRILAMVGGFSYPLSQLNRAAQSRRQPGSSLKPATYWAALSAGLQPNTLIEDGPITLPPIGHTGAYYDNGRDWWSPKNYDGGYSGSTTLRRALEQSKNLVTAHLLQGGGIAATPEASLDQICRMTMEAHVYQKCERYYPFILGAQPVRVLDMAVMYAAIANEGARPTPHSVLSIEQDGQTIFRATPQLARMPSTDPAATYQLKSILQGVVQRGTAASRANLAPYIAGKTGTSDDENDAWFVGFSNDVTIAVWVGYDNARGKRTLGRGQTGGKVALPIFEQIMNAVWEKHAPRTALRGPSPEAARQLVTVPIDVRSGEPLQGRGQGAFAEYFRLENGRLTETRTRLLASGDHSGYPLGDNTGEPWRDEGPFSFFSRGFRDSEERSVFGPPRSLFGPPQQESWQYRGGNRSLPSRERYPGQPQYEYQPWADQQPAQPQQRARSRERRVDPNAGWRERQAY